MFRRKEMKELIFAGTTLIVDRYSFSGVAFSAAKPVSKFENFSNDSYPSRRVMSNENFLQNMKEDWCWTQERGLPKPDLVLFLQLPLEKAANRNGYGDEQYENYDFQKKVLKKYNKMVDSSWKVSLMMAHLTRN